MKGLLFFKIRKDENMAKSYEMDIVQWSDSRKGTYIPIPLMLSGVPASFQCGRCDRGGAVLQAASLWLQSASTSSLINLLINVFIGLSIGANVLVARYYGAKNDRDMSETIHTAITVSPMSGLFLVFWVCLPHVSGWN